ncbi:hypothetical protein DSO57_1008197 [Entomophthora muscae]|uniref:Uncharacterized protein n=1 Tax=Entomophthora muscae TaxID=34485 RepID=A0ACC2U5J3_9FUNG|nr:hypothetical protein DSO57_1008197 [Entomophthora muscae]
MITFNNLWDTSHPQELLESLKSYYTITNQSYVDTCNQLKAQGEAIIHDLLYSNKIDSITIPSNMFHITTTSCSLSGYPIITVPAGFDNKLPFGISFYATANAKPLLIALSSAFEGLTPFLPTPSNFCSK